MIRTRTILVAQSAFHVQLTKEISIDSHTALHVVRQFIDEIFFLYCHVRLVYGYHTLLPYFLCQGVCKLFGAKWLAIFHKACQIVGGITIFKE